MANMGKSSDNQGSNDFLKQYGKYIAVIAVALILIIIIVFSGKKKDGGETTTGANTEVIGISEAKETESTENPNALKEDAYPEINQLINTYFTALRDQDVETLSNIMETNGEIDEEKIRKEGEYIEDYRNIKCYTREGIVEGSYIVFPYYDIKFLNVDTLAPSMIWLYVCTNEDGSLYINKSTFDGEVAAYIDEVCNSDEAKALMEQVETSFTAALQQDETLNQFVTKLREGADPTIPEETESQTEETTQAETEAPQQDENTGGDSQQSEETVYASQTVNVRKSPSTDGEQAGQLYAGESIQRIGTEGEWSKVLFEGEECYIKSEFLTAEQTQAADDGFEVVDEYVEALQNVRMRKSPSTEGEIVGTLDGGTEVHRIGYSEQWSRIQYNGETCYVASEFLR